MREAEEARVGRGGGEKNVKNIRLNAIIIFSSLKIESDVEIFRSKSDVFYGDFFCHFVRNSSGTLVPVLAT